MTNCFIQTATRPHTCVSGVSHLAAELFDGVLQGQDVAEQWTLQGVPQVPQGVAVGPLLPLDQFGVQTVQSSQYLLTLSRRH